MLPNTNLFGIYIEWYTFFHWLGVVAAYVIGYWIYRREKNKIPGIKMLIILLLLFPLSLLGSRIIGIVGYQVQYGEWPALSVIWAGTGRGLFRWCGTLLAFVLVLPLFTKWLKIERGCSLRFFDVMAISLCLLTVFTKQGCQFSGDGCYGIPTNLPWGMYYPYGVAPNILPVHPTPIYDSLFHLLLLLFLIWWNKRKDFAGQTVFLYLMIVPLFYIFLEIIRVNPVTSIGLTIPQFTYIAILLMSLFYYYARNGINPTRPLVKIFYTNWTENLRGKIVMRSTPNS